MDALGIEVSPTEFDAYLYGEDGFTVMPDLAQSFIDSTTGQFSSKMLQARIDEMKSSSDPEIQKRRHVPDALAMPKAEWLTPGCFQGFLVDDDK